MIQIGATIVSRDIVEKQFVCHPEKCKGMCCVYGESGAPLTDDEIAILQETFPKLKPYMTAEGIAVVERQGVYDTDFDNDKVTPLIDNREECVYSFNEKGVYYCAIEKAFMNGATGLRKPVSCHLYPIRITKYNHFEAVNYHHWHICGDALECGKKKKMPLYVFLKEALIRKYDAEWYDQLCLAAKALRDEKFCIKHS